MYKRQSLHTFLNTISRAVVEKKSGNFSLLGNNDSWGKISLHNGNLFSLKYSMQNGSQALPYLAKESEIQFVFKPLHQSDVQQSQVISNINNTIFFSFFGLPEPVFSVTENKDQPIPEIQPAHPAPKAKGLKKIIIVDDSRLIRKAIHKILETGNYDVIEAQDGVDGLAKIIEKQPDLIICDYIMPEMDGLMMIKLLKQTTGYELIPVILLTSKDALMTKIKAKMLTINQFLPKPVDRETLIPVVEKLLKH